MYIIVHCKSFMMMFMESNLPLVDYYDDPVLGSDESLEM